MNTEVLSTDEESSFEEDSDIEEMGKNIENMLTTSGKNKVYNLFFYFDYYYIVL